ncbi:MAG: hypothetical protein CM1200mP39_25840 [Dehalococcoidia bacterium]|nr:MAG: hypothetical protein CM1200mP39_25840 [Dehalococcoidia bacterium]
MVRGYIHDLTGSYDAVWQVGVVLGVVAAVLHAPINETPLTRTAKVGCNMISWNGCNS